MRVCVRARVFFCNHNALAFMINDRLTGRWWANEQIFFFLRKGYQFSRGEVSINVSRHVIPSRLFFIIYVIVSACTWQSCLEYSYKEREFNGTRRFSDGIPRDHRKRRRRRYLRTNKVHFQDAACRLFFIACRIPFVRPCPMCALVIGCQRLFFRVRSIQTKSHLIVACTRVFFILCAPGGYLLLKWSFLFLFICCATFSISLSLSHLLFLSNRLDSVSSCNEAANAHTIFGWQPKSQVVSESNEADAESFQNKYEIIHAGFMKRNWFEWWSIEDSAHVHRLIRSSFSVFHSSSHFFLWNKKSTKK